MSVVMAFFLSLSPECNSRFEFAEHSSFRREPQASDPCALVCGPRRIRSRVEVAKW
jgi:hypothetical protein